MANITRSETRRDYPTTREWDPFRMMEQMLRGEHFRETASYGDKEMPTFTPRFDVKETKEAYVFKADLPGVKDEDVDVSLTGNRLTICGKREMDKREENENWYAYERSFGSFTRAFTLPEGVDADNVKAELKDGVLTLAVPKKPEVQPRKIELNKGGNGKIH